MNSTERVMRALSFEQPDVMPLFDLYWPEFVDLWRQARGRPLPRTDQEREAEPDEVAASYGVDIAIITADETPWPSRATEIERRGDYVIRRDGWGKVIGETVGGYYYDEIAMPVREKASIDGLEFDSPALDSRYAACLERLARERARPNPPCCFAKVGGPYQRTGQNLRGVEQWLVDVAEDPEFAAALAGRVADHLIQIGLESLRRFNLYDTGLWIYDDMAYNHGMMVGPKHYEKVFLPLMDRMVRAFKGAGAKKVLVHSDGDVRSVLDMLVEVGIDGINPVEPKANMDAAALRARYGDRLALVGGICNARILPYGTKDEVREHVLSVLRAGIDGGLVIGTHSISPEISVERYDYFIALLRQHGLYPFTWSTTRQTATDGPVF